MNASYDKEEWAADTTRGRQVFNFRCTLTGSELKGWELLKVVIMTQKPDSVEKVYLWAHDVDPKQEMVRVSITERPSWRFAQESLYERLNECMRPNIPKGTKALAQIGDVNYVSREPQTDSAGAITFTRGNVCVSVSTAGEKNVDVSQIAASLDRRLNEPLTKAEAGKRWVPARVPKSVNVTAKKPVTLIDNLPEAAPRDGWLQVIVPDGELRRTRDSLIYVSPATGKKSVGAFAIRGG